ncbi:hypothetical protein CYY_006548 [Polysphondylium violaceum]|uniref:EF-hand domain-containing protein n=1 Tax=Polysphondylium violaceum TaxID=133409 RepID=A0A8J4PQU7_9MYCE|nr:hypothetical protein CYY_006548 [Polysphondylium violaceum]
MGRLRDSIKFLDSCDFSGDKAIDKQELSRVLREKKCENVDLVVEYIFKLCDKNGDNKLIASEIQKNVSRLKQYTSNEDIAKKCAILLAKADSNGDQKLNEKELEKYLSENGEDFPSLEAFVILDEFDVNKNGFLEMGELRKYVKGKVEQ